MVNANLTGLLYLNSIFSPPDWSPAHQQTGTWSRPFRWQWTQFWWAPGGSQWSPRPCCLPSLSSLVTLSLLSLSLVASSTSTLPTWLASLLARAAEILNTNKVNPVISLTWPGLCQPWLDVCVAVVLSVLLPLPLPLAVALPFSAVTTFLPSPADAAVFILIFLQNTA